MYGGYFMRRLWAYILLAVTSFVLVGVTFANVMSKVNSNIDYQSGMEMYFRVSEKEKSEDFTNPVELDDEGKGLRKVADDFAKRLDNSNVTSYEVKIRGKDTISVSFSQKTEEEYSNIRTYLTCDGSFALASPVPGNYATADQFLTDSEAYIDTYNSVPCVILPVDVDSEAFKTTYKSVVDAKTADPAKTEFAEETSSTNESGEETTAYNYYLYLFYNWNATAYEEAGFKESTSNTDNSSVNRYCMKFLVEDNEENQYFPDGENNKLFSAINLDVDGNGVISASDREVAYERARFFVNILNASSYDYKITYMYQNIVYNGQIENLFSYGDNETLALNATLIATFCGIVIIGFLLAVFYRLGALSISMMAILTAFAGVGAMVLLSAEYNAIALIGLVAIVVTSLVSGAIYLGKLKEEAYRGRSLKKANLEASRKSILPVVDVNVIIIVIGAFCYLFGGALMRSFAAVTVIGGLVSLILNTIGMKMMMWLATNTTSLQGKYEAFGINKEYVPDIANEEKQKYFGAYADRDLTKKKKPVGILALVLLVASSAGMIVFGSMNGSIYRTSNAPDVSTIYFETNTDHPETFSSTLMNEDQIKTITENLYVYGENKENAKPLSEYVSEIQNPASYTEINAEQETITYYQYVVILNSPMEETINAYYVVNDSLTIDQDSNEATDINSILTAVLDELALDVNGTVSFKEAHVYEESELNIGGVCLGTGVALAVLTAYFMLRYKLSRALASMLIATTMGVISVGLFSVLQMNVTSLVASMTPLLVAFTLMLCVIFMSKEKEMIAENHGKTLDLNARHELMVKADSASFTISLFVCALALYIAINFFGFGSIATGPTFGLMIVGVLLAGLFVSALLGPIAHLIYRWLRKINISKPRKKSRSNKPRKINKSAEPEEAVFIGIND